MVSGTVTNRRLSGNMQKEQTVQIARLVVQILTPELTTTTFR